MSRYGGFMLLSLFLPLAHGQPPKPLRMEILLEKEVNGKGVVMEPGHIFEVGDRLRFRFTPNFAGTLFVMDRGTTGSYTMLFPKDDTGKDDRLAPGKAYVLPSTDKGWFRISGPPGHDVVYFVVTSAKGATGVSAMPVPHVPPPISAPAEDHDSSTLVPRCNDELFRARGDCIDSTAGPKAAGKSLPENLTGMKARDLFFIRKDKASVVSSTETLDSPVVYEFHVAHK
jgi:Domain of unknown function (DUF4384)